MPDHTNQLRQLDGQAVKVIIFITTVVNNNNIKLIF